MSTTDWDSVTVIRKHNNTRPTVSKDAKTVNNAFREGNVITGKKYAAGSNLARNMTTDKNTARIADEVDAGHVEHVNRSVSETIQKARMDHEPTMKQSDLAKLINEKPNVIQQYESGQAIPNQQVLAKLERILKVKLRGKDIGQPFGKPAGGKAKP